MADTLLATFSNMFFWKKFRFLLQFHRIFIPEGPADTKLALIRVMACCQTGDKPWLPEAMMTQTYDATWHH